MAVSTCDNDIGIPFFGDEPQLLRIVARRVRSAENRLQRLAGGNADHGGADLSGKMARNAQESCIRLSKLQVQPSKLHRSCAVSH